jgi:hypothetical protein
MSFAENFARAFPAASPFPLIVRGLAEISAAEVGAARCFPARQRSVPRSRPARLDKWRVGPQTLPVLGFSMAEGDERTEDTKQHQTTRSDQRS